MRVHNAGAIKSPMDGWSREFVRADGTILSRREDAGRARRQRFKRAFRRLARFGEAARSDGKVPSPDPHCRDSALRVRDVALGTGAARQEIGSNTETQVPIGAAIDSPLNSRGIPNRTGPQPVHRVIPVRGPHRRGPPASQHAPQGHDSPEDGQCPDQPGPGFRHARDPRRRLRSSGMLSAPGLRDRIGLHVGTPRETSGSEVLASFTVSHEGRSTGYSVIRLTTIGVSRVEIPTPSPTRDARLMYQIGLAGQSASTPGIATFVVPTHPRSPRSGDRPGAEPDRPSASHA